VEEALVAYFGRGSVKRGNKAFNLKENSYRVEADVAPFFEHRRYHMDGTYLSGVELRPDNAPSWRVINWPNQHYENGVAKNSATSRRYKAMVRILKSLCIRMDESGITEARDLPGFLLECLVWNVPNSYFGHFTYSGDVRASLAYLYENTMTDDDCQEWGEVSELKYLFRKAQQWTREQAYTFISAARNYIGFE
jgi:hypothetical protein